MIKIAEDNYPDTRFILDDIINIDQYYKENSVYGAIAIYSLYFIPREKLNEVLSSLSRILKKGAKFLFATEIGTGEKYIETPLMIENNV